MKHILLLALLLACTHQPQIERLPSSTPYQRTWADYVSHNFLERHGVDRYFPDSEHLKPWQPDTDVVMGKTIPPYKFREKALSCKSTKLYPTHPSQLTKAYHYAIYSQYNHARLSPDSPGCLRKNPTGRFCLSPAIAKLAVMSDTYEDGCGNFYRGFWLVTYLKSDESMGTLYAKGRSAYEKPNSVFGGEYIENDTFALEKKNFFLLTELMAADLGKIRAEKARALRAGFKMKGKLFVR